MILRLLIAISLLAGTPALAKKAKKKKKAKAKVTTKKEVTRGTSFDFEETTLEGQMKAPPGMMLKGRVKQNKKQMVSLRKHYREGLRKSKSAVRAIKP